MARVRGFAPSDSRWWGADADFHGTEVAVSEKSTLIESIREINPSASSEWLEKFAEQDLREYLHHLQVSMTPAMLARWVRRNDRAPMVTRDAA